MFSVADILSDECDFINENVTALSLRNKFSVADILSEECDFINENVTA